MKNKSFYFLWKIHASTTSFSTKNKMFEVSSDVLKVGDLEAELERGKSTSFKMITSSHRHELLKLTKNIYKSSNVSIGSLGRSYGSILHKTGYNYLEFTE